MFFAVLIAGALVISSPPVKDAAPGPSLSPPHLQDPALPTDVELHGRPVMNDSMAVSRTSRGLIAFAVADQSRQWEAPLCAEITWADTSQYLLGSRVFVTCGNRLSAVEAATGSVEWTVPISATPDHVATTETSVVLAFASRIDVLDAATGAPRWSRAAGTLSHDVVADEHVVYVSDDSSTLALRIEDGSVVWDQPIDSGWLVLADHVLFVRGGLHAMLAVNPATGAVLWSTSGNDARLLHSRILGVTGHHVIVMTENHSLLTWIADTGTPSWSYEAPDDQTDGTVGQDRVALSGPAGLVIIDATTGAQLRHDDVGSSAIGYPTIAGTSYAYNGVFGIVIRRLP